MRPAISPTTTHAMIDMVLPSCVPPDPRRRGGICPAAGTAKRPRGGPRRESGTGVEHVAERGLLRTGDGEVVVRLDGDPVLGVRAPEVVVRWLPRGRVLVTLAPVVGAVHGEQLRAGQVVGER